MRLASLILLFGAEFTKASAESRGSHARARQTPHSASSAK
jgi:hypothetical protein